MIGAGANAAALMALGGRAVGRACSRAVLLSSLSLWFSPAAAIAQSFVRQTLVAAPLAGGDPHAAHAVTEALRLQLRRRADGTSLQIIPGAAIDRMLRGLGIRAPATATERDLMAVGRLARADEVLAGSVEREEGLVVVRGVLVLVRDPRQREPLPAVRSRTVAAAGDSLARLVLVVRAQMDGLRACENAGRQGDAAAAMRAAASALNAWPDALLARLCLARALIESGGRADSVLRLAEQALARDSTSIIARVLRAQALDGLARRGAAADAWATVLALRPDSADLAAIAAERLLMLDRPSAALVVLDSLAPRHAGDFRFARLRFRALHSLSRWAPAASLGDTLEGADVEFTTGAAYALRYVEALLQRGNTLRAVAKSARSVAEHPADGRLYVQYLRIIAGEGTVVLARGLERFPRLAELRVLAAQEARVAGDRAVERSALRAAIASDASLAQSQMRLAELWMQDGLPDSALAVLARAPRDGGSAFVLRAYAMGRGVELLRAAADTLPVSYRMPRAFLALADSVESREDTRGLRVAAALQAARSELVVAARVLDCDGLRRADAQLAESAALLAVGVGDGPAADELQQAQVAMRAAVDEALSRSCAAR